MDNKVVRRHQFTMCACKGRIMFFFENSSNMCMKMDLETYEIAYVEKFENIDMIEQDIADGIEIVKDKIYQLGIKGDCIYEIDLENRKCLRIEIDCHESSWGNYATYAYFSEKIFIFPKYKKKIVEFNTNTRKIEYDTNIYDKLEQYYIDRGCAPKGIESGCKVDEVMWLLTDDGKTIVSYNLRSKDIKIFELPCQIIGCQHIVFNNNFFYFLQGDGKIYSWNKEKMSLLLDVKYAESNDFYRMAITQNNIYILPSLGKNIMIYDIESQELKVLDDYPKDFCYFESRGWSKFYGYCESDEWYYFAMRLANYMLTINKISGEIKWIRPIYPTIDDDVRAYKRSSVSLYREEEWDLENYLQIISLKEKNYKNALSNLNGQMIWESIAKDIG